MTIRKMIFGAVCALALSVVSTPTASADSPYAPLDQPGPELSVPDETLRDALACHGNPDSEKNPVLLSPATGVTPAQNYAWNWAKLFADDGRYWCTVEMPYNTLGDIQVAAEYHVHAIRTMYANTGEKISILGHSQGGMNPRWALRFWPELRDKVDDMIGMAPSNHGTYVPAHCIERVTKCTPGVWQQKSRSQFVKALNSRAETFAGIDYTNVYTHLDEVVRPPAKSSSLTTGDGDISNVAVQDVCPTDPYEHVLTGTVSPTTHALVMDALDHDGPADPSRIDRSVCTKPYMPGIDPASLDTVTGPLEALPHLIGVAVPFISISGAPVTEKEPKLRCYVYAGGC